MPDQAAAVFRLSDTDARNRIVADAVSRCSFPWSRLVSQLGRQLGRDFIPVRWTDLSRFASVAEFDAHAHIREHGVTGHVLLSREAAMGLAWTDGRIELDYSCEKDPAIGGAVFLAESAHQVDFFYLTDAQRHAIFTVMHGGSNAPHEGHGWWEEAGDTDYYATMGETFMGLFVRAFSTGYEGINFGPFIHHATDEQVGQVRSIVLGDAPAPPAPTPTRVFGTRRGSTYHVAHRGVRQDVWWGSPQEAQAAGRRPCRICKAPNA